MASYLHPGVYLEEIPSGSRPIEGVPTSVVAFVGRAPKGPTGTVVPVGSFDEYVREFGPIASEDDAMGLAVQSYYLNGGKDARVCRLIGEGSAAASAALLGQGATGAGPTAAASLLLSALNPGDWGNAVHFRIEKPDPDSLTFDLVLGHREDGEFVQDEAFRSLSLREGEETFALSQVNGVSRLVELSLGPAGEVGNAAEAYQDAILAGGVCPEANDYFSTSITSPMTLTLNLNGLGARVITIDVAGELEGTANAADGAAVASAIEAAVHGVNSGDVYQSFTCTYTGERRFELTSPVDGSAASIEITNGALAALLRLDSTQVATLTGAALDSDADLFSAGLSGIAAASRTLTLNLDGKGDRTVSLALDPAALTADNAADGTAIARALQAAVRAAAPQLPSFRNFRAEYDAARHFVLRSGSAASRTSSLSVTDGPLADLLGLSAADNPSELAGRQIEQGTAPVVPVEMLGLLGEGTELAGGSEVPPTALDYANFYSTTLRKVREVSILVLPGEHYADDGTGNAVVAQTLAHCEAMQNRMLILDPPPGVELTQATAVQSLALPTSTYSTLYYPWIRVANPFFDVDLNPTAARQLTIAPSATVAGIWSKIDGQRGVWKAPAGVEAQLNGVTGLEFEVEDLEQDQLNPLGVNCIRRLPNFGSVVWGARTLATRAKPEWRYVPVRRTAIFIEQSIYGGIQWAVFEPNDHRLWSSLRTNVDAFMNGLFRGGAFQGETANQAYFVRCGLGATMTQGDIDRGQVIVLVGFAPLKPAEFVIVRIQQKVGQE